MASTDTPDQQQQLAQAVDFAVRQYGMPASSLTRCTRNPHNHLRIYDNQGRILEFTGWRPSGFNWVMRFASDVVDGDFVDISPPQP